MRRTMLATLSAVTGTLLLALFALCIRWQCVPVQAKNTVFSFPQHVKGTNLTALQLVSYEGPFWEDRSQREVVQTAALLVENSGGYLASGAVILETPSAQMVFELYDLPPGEKVLVLEKDGQSFPGDLPSNCYGWDMEFYPENMGHVTAEHAGGMTMAVVNRSAGVVPVARVCYRTRDPGSGFYLGGISYSVDIYNLQPGERRLITPPYYAGGSSEILYTLTWAEE